MVDESGYAVIEMLKMHIKIFFGQDDEYSTAKEEARSAELIQAITQAACKGQYTSEMQAMVEELNRVKSIIADKKSKQTDDEKSSERINEILAAIDSLKDSPIAFDNQAEDEITIIFKGGFERTVALK